MNLFFHNLLNIVYSIFTAIIIFTIGMLFGLKYYNILSIMIIFMVIRSSTESYHYESRIKCFIFTILIYTILFLVAKLDFIISVAMTIVASYMLTDKADLNNTFQHFNSKNEKKYREMTKYIQNNKRRELREFENVLKTLNISYSERYRYDFYEVYNLYFLEEKSFKDIKQITGIRDNHGVTRALDVIFMIFNTYLETKKSLTKK